MQRELSREAIGTGSQSALAALTRLNNHDISRSDELTQLRRRYIGELLDVSAAQGWELRGEIDVGKLTRPAPPHRPSMLQDALAGRPMEIEAQVGQV